MAKLFRTEVRLSEYAIDETITRLGDVLKNEKIELRDLLNLRFSVETILIKWRESLRNQFCELVIEKRLGRLEISAFMKEAGDPSVSSTACYATNIDMFALRLELVNLAGSLGMLELVNLAGSLGMLNEEKLRKDIV